MSNNPAKYEVLIKQYLRSILDISDNNRTQTLLLIVNLFILFSTIQYNELKKLNRKSQGSVG